MHVHLSPFASGCSIMSVGQRNWFPHSERLHNCSKKLFVCVKMGICNLNRLVWFFFYLGLLLCSLSFSKHYIQWQSLHTLWFSLCNIFILRFLSSKWGTSACIDGYGRPSLSWHDWWEWTDIYIRIRFPSWSPLLNQESTLSKITNLSK